MNDDTVPDGGKSIGLDGGRTLLSDLKVLSFGLTLAMALCTQAVTYEVDGIEWSFKKITNLNNAEIRGEEKSLPAIDRSTRGFVTVPLKLRTSTVTRIGHNAFNSCRYITGVDIHEKVTYIGTNAFNKCSSLKEVTIAGKITDIKDGTFRSCSSLERVSFTNTVKKIGARAFSGCRSLVDIKMLDNVESIGEDAFNDCDSLTDVALPKKLKSLGDSAFFSCDSLESVSIPDGLTDIPLSAFYLCNSLKTLEVDANNPVYSSRNNILCDKSGTVALLCAPGLLEVDIPEGITNIAQNSFERCLPLQRVNIPDSVLWIGHSAFWGCESLQSVTIPKNVQGIGYWAFTSCDQLQEFKVAEENPRYSARNGMLCSKSGKEVICCPEGLKEVEIPEGVVGISEMAFGYNTNIVKIVIPDSVVYIGYAALYYCKSLAEVHLSERYSGPMDVFPASATIIRYSPVAAVADGEGAVQSRIASAMEEFADTKLTEVVSNETQYVALRTWLERRSDMFNWWFMDSPNAKFAYMLDAGSPFASLPRSEDLKINGFERRPESEGFDLSVSAGGIYVGEDALPESLETLFGVEGSATLSSAGFSSGNVSAEFCSPVDGKLKIKVTPKTGAAKSFFFRMKVK